MMEDKISTVQLTDQQLAAEISRPGASDHKYSRGVVGMICGSEQYPGAALMSTKAAVNTGPGMVRFIGSEQLNFQIQQQSPEVVCSKDAPENLHVQAWAVGSGATSDERQDQLIYAIQAKEAAVLDAAAIDIAGRWVGTESDLAAHKILTPHAGELEGFMQWLQALNPQRWQKRTEQSDTPSREDIEAQPAFWAQKAAQLSGATVVLKGSPTLIASSEGEVISVDGGTAWLATAGSGDTLTGIMGALLASSEAKKESGEEKVVEVNKYARIAACAVRIHHIAADLVHTDGLEGPVPPSIVVQKIPQAVARFLAS